MIQIVTTSIFDDWLDGLRDQMAIQRIQIRIRRLSLGNPGHVKPVGGGVSELRIDHGPGYRVYFCQRGAALVVLLCGGGKKTQSRDIEEAKRLASEL